MRGKREIRKGPHYSKRRVLFPVFQQFNSMLRQEESQRYLTTLLEQETYRSEVIIVECTKRRFQRIFSLVSVTWSHFKASKSLEDKSTITFWRSKLRQSHQNKDKRRLQ